MNRARWLMVAFASGTALLLAWFLAEVLLDASLPAGNPDAYLWAGGVLAGLVGAAILARATDMDLPSLGLGATSAAAGYGLALMLVMAGLPLFAGWGCAYPEATWHQNGLYDAIDPEQAPDGWSLEAREPTGMPFSNGTLDDAWGADTYALTRVAWEGPQLVHGRGGGFGLALSAPGEVTARARGEANETEIAEHFTRFAENVTDADEQTISNWTDAFLGSKHLANSGRMVRGPEDPGTRIEIYAYSVNLTEPLTLSELYASLTPAPPSTNLTAPEGQPFPERVIGQAETSAENWTFTFGFPTVRAENEDRDGEHVRRITIDALDRAGVVVSLDETEGYPSRTVELVEEAFDALGWPDPSVREERVQMGAVC